ncbi:hypothetical protein NLX74_24045 [Paenibacillus sp. MZ03-122A]|nr:hypothetical protein [Paenibacillus sp. MZ03-122A]
MLKIPGLIENESRYVQSILNAIRWNGRIAAYSNLSEWRRILESDYEERGWRG